MNNNLIATSTKARILLCAEKAYAQGGLAEFTLRSLADSAVVNLAAINYHFRTKQTLIEAMLLKVLSPLYQERVALLCQVQQHYGENTQPTHVMAALLLPLIREILVGREKHHLAFMRQSASDTSPCVRHVLDKHFSSIGSQFEQAFAKCSSELPADEASWRSRIFCNALPGSVNNRSTGEMCISLLASPMTSVHDAMVKLGCLAESVLVGYAKKSHVMYVVADLFKTMRDFPTVEALRYSHSDSLLIARDIAIEG